MTDDLIAHSGFQQNGFAQHCSQANCSNLHSLPKNACKLLQYFGYAQKQNRGFPLPVLSPHHNPTLPPICAQRAEALRDSSDPPYDSESLGKDRGLFMSSWGPCPRSSCQEVDSERGHRTLAGVAREKACHPEITGKLTSGFPLRGSRAKAVWSADSSRKRNHPYSSLCLKIAFSPRAHSTSATDWQEARTQAFLISSSISLASLETGCSWGSKVASGQEGGNSGRTGAHAH